jgi:UDP-N-acetylglucosamine 2-epimerase (non-hydrolysing)
MIVFGTRPEVIKLAPLIRELKADQRMETIVCSTGQHHEMLKDIIKYFEIDVDVNLQVMQPNQKLYSLTARCLERLGEQVETLKPSAVVAQGDTTSAMAASLIAFYHRCPLVHVEAGLRTGNLQAPWPEEMNRRIVSVVASIHCAPTSWAAENLRKEGIDPAVIHTTGNTVVDAALWTLARELKNSAYQAKYKFLGDKKVILITGHRRENFGAPFEEMCGALLSLSKEFPDYEFVYPVHLNPNVRDIVHKKLSNRPNIHLHEPLSYPEFIWLMNRSYLILSDSGGIQEEAPSFKKPLLILRDVTERPEAVSAGTALLVGCDSAKIISKAKELLTDQNKYKKMQASTNPFGDGLAAKRIVSIIFDALSDQGQANQETRLAS